LPSQIALLANLQLVDQSLRAKTGEVAESQQKVGALEEVLQEQTTQTQAARADLDLLASRQRELEKKAANNEAQSKDRRMRIARIRNEKELAATKRELELLKEETTALETELLALMEQVEAADAKVKGLEEQLAATETAIAAEAETLKATVARLGAEIAAEQAQRAAMVETLDVELRRKYEMILDRRGGIAVVEVRGGTCLGCRMRVPPQLFNNIQRGEQVILCPSCQRILFWRPEGGDEASE